MTPWRIRRNLGNFAAGEVYTPQGPGNGITYYTMPYSKLLIPALRFLSTIPLALFAPERPNLPLTVPVSPSPFITVGIPHFYLLSHFSFILVKPRFNQSSSILAFSHARPQTYITSLSIHALPNLLVSSQP
jgi:hypothetical protein